MIIYRYEKEDGGGPFCTKDGYLRTNKDVYFDDDTLYGCISIDSLNKWFKNYKDLIKDCYIVAYSIPDKECIIRGREVIFPKKYSYSNFNVDIDINQKSIF